MLWYHFLSKKATTVQSLLPDMNELFNEPWLLIVTAEVFSFIMQLLNACKEHKSAKFMFFNTNGQMIPLCAVGNLLLEMADSAPSPST